MTLAEQVTQASADFHEREDQEFGRFSRAERFALVAVDAAERGELVLAAECLRVAAEIHESFRDVRL